LVNSIDGSASTDNPFVDRGEEAGRYYAYGIRDSYGFDFDPLTLPHESSPAKLWDAENGEDVFDEINIVEPGFNSGWNHGANRF
jgi:glucose/arabinose dehydrogenase